MRNCFHCGDAIAPNEEFTYNQSHRLVCIDCEDTNDQESARAYNEWAEFNGCTPLGDYAY